VKQVNPAVLQIVTESFGSHNEDRGEKTSTVSNQTGIGTGFVVSADGDLLTNAHVVAGARRVRVHLHDTGAGTAGGSRGKLVDARVVGVDRETDLALLKVDGAWRYLKLGDSGLLRQGQIVLAVGSPRGLENSVTMGVISAPARQIDPDASQAYIQTDAPINPGNSGGRWSIPGATSSV
jgi:serine protease Do